MSKRILFVIKSMMNITEFLEKVDNTPFESLDQILSVPLNAADWVNQLVNQSVNLEPISFSRQRVHLTPSGQVEVLVLTWPPGYSTLPHDHAQYGCWLKVLQGSLTESRYGLNLHKTQVSTLETGQSSFMCNDFGYHSIANTTTQPAYSLHLYSPPFHKTVTVVVENTDLFFYAPFK